MHREDLMNRIRSLKILNRILSTWLTLRSKLNEVVSILHYEFNQNNYSGKFVFLLLQRTFYYYIPVIFTFLILIFWLSVMNISRLFFIA